MTPVTKHGPEALGLLLPWAEHTTTALAVVRGPDHRYVYANPAYCRATGVEPASLIGRTVAEVFPGGTPARDGVALLDRVHAAGETIEATAFAVRLRPGEPTTWWDFRHVPLRDAPDGPVTGVLIEAHDVTAHIRARDAAERAGATLDALMAHIPEGITIAEGADVRITRVSAYGVALTERAEAELTGIGAERHAQAWQVLHADGRPATVEELPLTRATRQGEAVQGETWWLRRPDGSVLPILCNAGPIRDAAGRVTGGVIAWRDISAQRAAEEALREREAMLRLAVDAGGLAVWEVEVATGAVLWDEAGHAICGLEPGTRVNVEFLLSLFHPEDKPVVEAALARSLDPAEAAVFEVEVRARRVRDGAWRILAARGRALFEGEGAARRAVRMIGVLGDVTDRKESEALLREALAARALLLRETHHRIQNNLALVSSLLSLQRGRTADPEAQEALAAAAMRVAGIAEVHRLLQDAPDLGEVALGPLLEAIAGGAAALAPPGVAVSCHAAPGLALDAKRAVPLGLVCNELVTNALKHGFPDGRAGRVRVRVDAAADGAVRLAVEDDGIGRAPEEENGRGLGATIVRALAGQLGATMRQAGGPGAGTVIEIVVPAAEAPGGAPG